MPQYLDKMNSFDDENDDVIDLKDNIDEEIMKLKVLGYLP